VVGVPAIRIRKYYDILEKFVNDQNIDCHVVSQTKKELSFGTNVYVDKYTTLSCDNVTLRFEEGLGKFSATLIIGDFAVNIAYIYPEYIAFIYLNYDDDVWDGPVILVKEDEFEKIGFTGTTTTKPQITLQHILKKLKEVERKYIEILWPRQKLVYTAWVAYAMEKLGLQEQKTT
jgi:hypothetical protein